MNETETQECPLGICDGSGEVMGSYYDSDSHCHIPEVEDCLCRKHEPDHDPDL